MTFEQAFQILMLAAGVLVFWWTHKSFPPNETTKLINDLSEASKHTQTRLDDILVEAAKLLNDMRMQESVTVDDPPMVVVDPKS